eukprot:scaffold214960_cov22-Tisochrysis_lutea.AAC.1
MRRSTTAATTHGNTVIKAWIISVTSVGETSGGRLLNSIARRTLSRTITFQKICTHWVSNIAPSTSVGQMNDTTVCSPRAVLTSLLNQFLILSLASAAAVIRSKEVLRRDCAARATSATENSQLCACASCFARFHKDEVVLCTSALCSSWEVMPSAATTSESTLCSMVAVLGALDVFPDPEASTGADCGSIRLRLSFFLLEL